MLQSHWNPNHLKSKVDILTHPHPHFFPAPPVPAVVASPALPSSFVRLQVPGNFPRGYQWIHCILAIGNGRSPLWEETSLGLWPMFSNFRLKQYTPPEVDIGPEKRPSETESHVRTIIFQGLCQFSGLQYSTKSDKAKFSNLQLLEGWSTSSWFQPISEHV